MLTITATELRKNLDKYLEMMTKKEIAITKNGKYIGSLVPPKNEKLDSFLNDLTGILNEKDYKNSNDDRIEHILSK